MPTRKLDVHGFAAALREAAIHFTMASRRSGMVMVEVTVPGERWEVEFDEAGGIEIEIFKSDGSIFDETKIADLLARFAR